MSRVWHDPRTTRYLTCDLDCRLSRMRAANIMCGLMVQAADCTHHEVPKGSEIDYLGAYEGHNRDLHAECVSQSCRCRVCVTVLPLHFLHDECVTRCCYATCQTAESRSAHDLHAICARDTQAALATAPARSIKGLSALCRPQPCPRTPTHAVNTQPLAAS